MAAEGPSLTARMHRLEVAVNQAVLEHLAEARASGIKPSHISFVDQMGYGCRMNELARRLGLTAGAVSQIADQMERLGLVKRAMDPTDRRAVIVRPTARVRRAWNRARQIVDQVEAGWAQVLGEKRYRELERMVDELVAAAESGPEHGL